VLAAGYMGHGAAAQGAVPQACITAAKSPLIVNVGDKGAKGEGRTDDTAAIQAAIDEVGGKRGTILMPMGTYVVEAVEKKRRLALGSNMTLKFAGDAMPGWSGYALRSEPAKSNKSR
jgi:polygalacturonase